MDLTDFWLRAILFGMAGNLANILAEELRLRSTQYRQTAEQLAEANVHIRQAEEAVRRSDRLAALGQLSAGLAHELRNPMATIRTSAEMLTRKLGAENDVAREMAGFIGSEVDRANSLITRFLQFARPLQLRLEKADLTQTLDRAVGTGGARSGRHRHLQELRARYSAVSVRCGAAGARLLQPAAQRRPGHRARRRGDAETARLRRQRLKSP